MFWFLSFAKHYYWRFEVFKSNRMNGQKLRNDPMRENSIALDLIIRVLEVRNTKKYFSFWIAFWFGHEAIHKNELKQKSQTLAVDLMHTERFSVNHNIRYFRNSKNSLHLSDKCSMLKQILQQKLSRTRWADVLYLSIYEAMCKNCIW